MADNIMKIGLILSATDKMSRVVDNAVNKSLNKVNKFQKHTAFIGGAIQKMGVAMTGAGALIEGGMFAAAKSVSATASELARSSQKVGMNVEQWQKISYAASRTSVDADMFRSSLQRLQKQQVAASMGNKAAAQSFAMAGISIKDASGKLKSSDVLFTELADKFKNAPDGPKKTALAMRLFGKAGAELIPLLNRGSEGISEFEKQAEEMGIVLSKDQISNFKKYGQETRKAKDAMLGLKNTIAVGALPVLMKITEKIVKLDVVFVSWTKRHKTLTTGLIGTVAAVAGFLTVVGTGSVIIGTIIKSVGLVTKAFSAMKFAAFALRFGIFQAGTAIKGWAIWSKIAAAGQWIWNASLYGCPVVWIIAGIMAIIAAVILIVKYWKPITAFFKRIWAQIKTIFKPLKNWFNGIAGEMKKGGWHIVKGLAKGIWDAWSLPYRALFKGGKILIEKFKSMFGIHSPSRLFAEYGVNITAGLAKGIDKGSNTPVRSTKLLADRTASAFAPASGASNSIEFVYAPNITLQSGTEKDRESFMQILRGHKREIKQILDEIQRNGSRTSFLYEF